MREPRPRGGKGALTHDKAATSPGFGIRDAVTGIVTNYVTLGKTPGLGALLPLGYRTSLLIVMQLLSQM